MRLPTQREIQNALELEFAATPKHLDFMVSGKQRDGDVWKVKVDVEASRSSKLDESLEGSRAWWRGNPNGSADVLSALADEGMLHLRFATCEPPNPGEWVRVYPPIYIDALLAYWRTGAKAKEALRWLSIGLNGDQFDHDNIPRNEHFPWLRARQRESFSLAGWNLSFLWGPPGTGKTTTLGALLASYLTQFPEKKVLLLSTTNVAVDLALVALDSALEKLGSAAAASRRKCFRLGQHFSASHYKGREHLIPVQRPELIQQLNDLDSNKPDPSNAKAYAAWKAKVESVKRSMRENSRHVLDRAQLVAMTVARGVYFHSDLQACGHYDLLAFDESSQVGIPYALALAPLARHAIFAGDPRQLAPIARSSNKLAQKWLGQSMFAFMEEGSARCCLLNAQSRMQPEIGEVVSTLFYGGKLTLAEDKRTDLIWNLERRLYKAPAQWREPLHLFTVESEGKWSQKYKGPIRFESAEAVCKVISELTTGESPSNILVLTPFRAQRSLIRVLLSKKGIPSVKVSTVHRAQGSEEHTVIFDPVAGNDTFLQSEDARRLINVALSRAAARLVVILSAGDRKNMVLGNLGSLLEQAQRKVQVEALHLSAASAAGGPNQPGAASGILPVTTVNQKADFPQCVLGKLIQIKDVVGTVSNHDPIAGTFTLKIEGGEARLFSTKYVRRIQ